ncbi:MAG: hypothetical protein IKU64_07655 [Bacteroides sp.]|nr:hypothetical protein [Bacteroides sp.]
MKFRYFLAMVAAALVMTNCSQEEELVQVKQNSKSFTATIEGSSRSAVDETTGAFSWTVGDKISVYTGRTFDTYANSESDVNTFTFVPVGEEEAGTPLDYAIYPAGNHTVQGEATITLSVNLPTSYAHGSTNAPMLATIEQGSNALSFKHLAGVMRFVVKNVPAGASSFVFTTTNNIITGNHPVSDGLICQNGVSDVSSENNNVTITFTELTETAESMVFYVPLPVGTYGDYTVSIKGNGVNLSHQSIGVTNTIGRRTLLLMPEFYVDGGQLNKGAGSTIDVTQEEPVAISGNQSLTINTTGVSDAVATLKLNYTPQEDNATLSLSDGSTETTPQESVAKVQINPQGTTPVEALNINTPTLTVELGAGNYGRVEALTAQQTLIIGAGATIESLTINGGKVVIDEGATIRDIIVKDEAALHAAVGASDKVILGANIDLTSSVVISSGDLTVNLNEKEIKCAKSDVFVVNDGTLTIEGEGLVYGSKDNEGNSCAVWVNGANAKAIIKSGTYKVGGDINGTTDQRNDCIYVGSAGGTIEIYGGVFEYTGTVKDGSLNDGSKFLVNQNDAHTTQLITVYGGTFHSFNPANASTNDKWMTNGVGSYVAAGYSSVAGEDGTYEVMEGILNETALKAAIAAGETEVTLGGDIELTSSVVIRSGSNVAVNLNEYDIEATGCDAFKVLGDLTINADDESAISANGNGVCAVWACGGTVTIKGGHYSVGRDSEGLRNDCIYAGWNADEQPTGGQITIEGGTFEFVDSDYTVANGKSEVDYDGDQFLLNCADKDATAVNRPKITVKGGKFKNHVPGKENYGTEGEVVLEGSLKVYKGEVIVTEAHRGNADVWYEVK